MSPAALAAMASDLASRYTSPKHLYRGTVHVDELLDDVEALARQLFGCRHAEVRPVSGQAAAMSVLLWARGRTVMRIAPSDGGYPGYGPEGAGEALGIRMLDLPYNAQAGTLDHPAAAQSIRRERPAAVILGASLFCFPYDMAPLTEAAREAGARVLYDGSHVLGLIAGGEFQRPLAESADALFGSTHKTFPGPQGGLLLSNDFEELSGEVQYKTVDNAHYHRIAALGIAMEELLPVAGRYARRVVENAHHLARCLHESGVAVRFAAQGFTRSHQVLLEPEPLAAAGGTEALSLKLEHAGIIPDVLCRLGTAEVSGRGMGRKEMEQIAAWISEVAGGARPEALRPRAEALAREFPRQTYGARL